LHIADIPSPSFLPYLLKEASSHQYLITLWDSSIGKAR
jgi:hypothetical protein